MNTLSIFTLKVLRKLYTKTFGSQLPSLQRVEDTDKASEMIYELLMRDEPCMIARFGAFELATIVNYLGVISPRHSIVKLIKGEQPEWWWNEKLIRYMNTNAGFFPPTHEAIGRYCELMLKDTLELDLLESWNKESMLKKESMLSSYLMNCTLVNARVSEPYFLTNPWTMALEGKNVLVIHPFALSIQKQYEKREYLFKNPKVLPKFNLKVIKAVQSINGDCQYKDWFSALESMKNQIDSTDFDICLIGCGAYGFPLAAHVKRIGKKAVHLASVLQLLFGIRGARWENPNYNSERNYMALMNKYWVRPDTSEKPLSANNVEGGCYW